MVAEGHVLTPAEWSAAVQRKLDALGLTFDDLSDMSRRRGFTTLEARKLWLTIGGRRP